MPAFEAPHVFASSDGVLETARTIVDHDAAKLIASEHEITCRAGCRACCNQAVPVSPAEVRSIRAFLAAQSDERRASFESRIESSWAALQRSGINADVPPPGDPERAPFVDRYFEAGVPCPLLEHDGTCGVRPVRPLSCREYLVASDPVHCTTLNHPQTVRLVAKRDAIAGFRSVSTAFGEQDIGVLAIALAHPAPPPPDAGPLSGPGVMQRLTSTYRDG